MEKSPNVISMSAVGRRPIPVLIVQGLPGSGKSTLLEEMARAKPGARIQFVGGFPDLGNEDSCNQCTLTNFLVEQVETALRNAWPSPQLDLLWIETPVELDVARLTEALEEIREVRVQAVVTSIGGGRFFRDFTADRSFGERYSEIGASPDQISKAALLQPVLEAWIDQIERCDLICLYGSQSEAVCRILQHINPRARILSPEEFSRLDPLEVVLFDKEQTYQSAAWQLALRSTPRDLAPECFRSRRPFHPGRFNALIERWPASILRSSGTVWLASHNHLSLTLNQVGPAGFILSPEGYWIATLSPLEQQATLQSSPELTEIWDPKHGDRMTEIAFVADQPLTEEWLQALNACVLTDLEMRLNWSDFENPFPTFEEDDSGRDTKDLPAETPKEGRRNQHLQLVNSSVIGGGHP
jgi:G3E family GTPase